MEIDLKRFLCSLIGFAKDDAEDNIVDYLTSALQEQGLEYKNGEIIKTQRRVAAEAEEAIFDNEDERIRKGILQVMYNRRDWMENPSFGNIKIEEAIAWLEKQGEQKPDKCDGCNNYKGCIACVDGDNWAHYEEVEQKPIKIWHDVSEIPYLYEEEELLIESEIGNYVAKYNSDTKQFLFAGVPVNGVIRWAYVSDILTQSVTKISEQVWSEEDESHFSNVLTCIENRAIVAQKDMYWLISLKQRLKGE